LLVVVVGRNNFALVTEQTRPRSFTSTYDDEEDSIFAPQAASAAGSASPSSGSAAEMLRPVPMPGRAEITSNHAQFWATRQTTELKMDSEQFVPNFNSDVTQILEELGIAEKNTGDGIRHKAYMKAAVSSFATPVFVF
jgi:hypothetical protein